MRRGLLTWDASELPLDALDARIERLRAEMRAQDLGAIVAYTSIARPAIVSWLSGFTPYWSEGLLCVPREGDIVFATALSKRVAEWISTVMPKGVIVPTPRPGTAISKRLATIGGNRIGVPDLDDVPARQVKDLLVDIPGAEIVDASELFNGVRRNVDESERRLVRWAAEIANAAMANVNTGAATAQALIAPCEGHARKAAAEEIFLSVVPDLASGARFQRTDTAQTLGPTFTLRLSLAYKGGWVRLARSFARDHATSERFTAAGKALTKLSFANANDPATAIRETLEGVGAKLHTWSIEQPRGSYPLVTVASSANASSANASSESRESDFNPASPCTVNVECTLDGVRWLASQPFA